MQLEGQAIEQRQESTMRIVCKLIVETCNPLAFIGWYKIAYQILVYYPQFGSV
jgi:hypothetical protein